MEENRRVLGHNVNGATLLLVNQSVNVLHLIFRVTYETNFSVSTHDDLEN